MPKAIDEPRPGRKTALYIFTTLLMLPFVYLTSLALLLSAYVHGWAVPNREFLKVYAAPSNAMVAVPAVGSLYSNYFQFCVRVTKADYEPNQTRSTEQ